MTNNLFMDDLIESIRFVYEKSAGYFTSTIGRERSIVFRIAHRLANTIEGEGIFVDIEPTRCNNVVKKIILPKADGKHKIIIPDLIIHQRKDKGFLVVEFKCRDNEWQNDNDKLVYLTKKGNKPHYKLGVFVYLTNKLNNIEIKIFQNGEEDKKLTEEYQNKIRLNN